MTITTADYDTIVVGGGPSGATAAHDLARQGHNFVLPGGISAMCRSQKNRISIRAARSAGTQFRFIGRYKRNTLKRTEYQYKLLTL